MFLILFGVLGKISGVFLASASLECLLFALYTLALTATCALL
jgi:hypothetical protein